MLRVMLDTDILIDSALSREPGGVYADKLLAAGKNSRQMRALIAPLSLKDTYFVVSKKAGEPHARTFLEMLVASCDILSVDAKTCAMALAGPESDFEDGLIAAAAIQGGADIIISRDEAAFNNLPIPKIDPRVFADFFLVDSPYPSQTDEHWAVITIPDGDAENGRVLA